MGWNSVFFILQLAIDRIVERISTLIAGKADLNVRQTLSAHLRSPNILSIIKCIVFLFSSWHYPEPGFPRKKHPFPHPSCSPMFTLLVEEKTSKGEYHSLRNALQRLFTFDQERNQLGGLPEQGTEFSGTKGVALYVSVVFFCGRLS